MAALIDEAGLPRAEPPARVPNSRAAQRVAISAGERRGELLARYKDAYWARGRDIGDERVVVEEAEAAGLDAAAVRDVLADPRAFLDVLEAETRFIGEQGATGVPAWIVDGRVLVPGAQPHEVFERILGRLGHAPR